MLVDAGRPIAVVDRSLLLPPLGGRIHGPPNPLPCANFPGERLQFMGSGGKKCVGGCSLYAQPYILHFSVFLKIPLTGKTQNLIFSQLHLFQKNAG